MTLESRLDRLEQERAERRRAKAPAVLRVPPDLDAAERADWIGDEAERLGLALGDPRIVVLRDGRGPLSPPNTGEDDA
jgi:hypothetical protein